MLILVTGVPGSGKSLYTVDLIEKYRRENEKLIEKGELPRPIYSDIDGLDLEGVEKSPDDWRDCPDGSIVVYDECQKKFGPDGQGRSSRGDIQEFETHRHRGFDIILITLHPKLLHAHIRRLVGRHYHVYRLHGSHTAKIFQNDGQIDIDKVAGLNKQDSFVWQYPKQHFDKYKSATIHTHKKQLPHYLKRTFMFSGGFLIFAFFAVPYAMPFLLPDSAKSEFEEQQVSSVSDGSKPVKSSSSKPKTRFLSEPVACVSNDVECICYDQDGYRLDLEYLQCIENTHGFSMYIDLRSTSKRRAVASADG